MVSRARRRLTAEERRAKILSAAVQVFATDGYDRTSMDHIAALSKVTKPPLYDHFPAEAGALSDGPRSRSAMG